MIPRPHLVISIQSQVVFGHVGNSAAVFPLQAAGLEVVAIPTVLFSNIPSYPTLRGRALPAEFFADLLLGVRERGLLERADFILTGYVGSIEVAEQLADFVAEAKAINPALIYHCDPVIGDTRPGQYVSNDIAVVMRDRLMPLADVATPNQFEVAWLTGEKIESISDLKKARSQLALPANAQLIVTGCSLSDTPEDQIESVILGPDGVSRHQIARLPIALSGTGDLFAALIIVGLDKGLPLTEAVENAQRLTAIAMRRASELGATEVVFSDPVFRQVLLG